MLTVDLKSLRKNPQAIIDTVVNSKIPVQVHTDLGDVILISKEDRTGMLNQSVLESLEPMMYPVAEEF